MKAITRQISRAVGRISKSFLAPEKPAEYFLVGTDKFTDRLTYESSFEDEGRTLFLLSDSALATFWEVTHIPHEIESEARLQEFMGQNEHSSTELPILA